MRYFNGGKLEDIIVVALDSGDDLLLSIKEVIKEAEIKNGIIVSGIGSLKKARYHIVEEGDNGKSFSDKFIKKEGWIEIVSMSGIIANGEPHIHISLSQDDKGFGGHLEEGCIILTLAEIVIVKIEKEMERRISEEGFGRLYSK